MNCSAPRALFLYGLRPARFLRSLNPGARPRHAYLTVAIAAAGLLGCSSTGSSRSDTDPYAGVDRTARQTRDAAGSTTQDTARGNATSDSRHVALVGGEPLSLADLLPALEEAAGGMILEEVALDRLIARELATRNTSVSDADIEQERQILQRTLSRGIVSTSDQAVDLIGRLRTSRGLGDARFATLLRRNAGLRALVRNDVQVSSVDLEIAYQIRYGVRYRTRLILLRSELDAAEARARLLGRDGRAPEAFSSVASQMSIDPSGARGGTIGLVSPVDPSFPEAVRAVVSNLAPGAFSQPIALQDGFAIVAVDEIVPAQTSVTPDSVATELQNEVRLVREQSEMTKLASRLLSSISVTPLDPSLNWGWKAWRSQNGQ